MHIKAIEGNRQKLDGGSMFGNVPRSMWAKWMPPDEEGRIELACRSLLIRHKKKHTLLEAGIGCFFEPKMAERFGVFPRNSHVLKENLLSQGIDPKEIHYLILSHLHFDHAGGLLKAYGTEGEDFIFPNAQFVVGKEAFLRAENPHPRDRASFIPGLTEKLKASNRLILIDKHTILPDLPISFLETYGHTPGHIHSLIQGDRQKVFFCGDLIPGLSWLHTPVTMGYDRFPELVIDEKKEICDRAAQEKWLMFYTHDPVYAASYCMINRDGKIAVDGTALTLSDWLEI